MISQVLMAFNNSSFVGDKSGFKTYREPVVLAGIKGLTYRVICFGYATLAAMGRCHPRATSIQQNQHAGSGHVHGSVRPIVYRCRSYFASLKIRKLALLLGLFSEVCTAPRRVHRVLYQNDLLMHRYTIAPQAILEPAPCPLSVFSMYY